MPSVTVSYDELGERGRGLALVQMTTDRFEYQRTIREENIWIIVKRFPG
jgi:anti-sigma regulatory factor (Ser/Thr protein kinase)